MRVWDCATYSCLSIIHPNPVPGKDAPGPLIPLDQPQQLLKCARSPGNTCVRFDTGGNWLLIGNTEGYLVLWSVKLSTAVAHTQCVKSTAATAAAAAGGGPGGTASGAAGSGGSSVAVPQVRSLQPLQLLVRYASGSRPLFGTAVCAWFHLQGRYRQAAATTHLGCQRLPPTTPC